jgi:hypothetical protein
MWHINMLRVAAVLAAVSVGFYLPQKALAAASDDGAVLAYDRAFFAASQPATAYDMIERLPAFQFDDGSDVRGFAGAAGNVLIDGARPTAKTDDLESILSRIPASQVTRIMIIRGGAPGIDMQGQSVVANVILTHAAETTLIATAENTYFGDGHDTPGGSLHLSHSAGQSTYNLTLTRYSSINDDSAGDGFVTLIRPGVAAERGTARRRGAEKPGWGVNGDISLPLWGGKFGANATLQRQYFNWRISYGAPLSANYFQANRYRPIEVGLNWAGDVADGAGLTVLMLQRLNQYDYDNTASDLLGATRFALSRDTGETITRATLRYRWSDSLTLENGVEGDYNTLKGDSSLVQNGAAVIVPAAHSRVGEWRGEAFTKARWTITPVWALEAGVRAEVSRIAARGTPARSLSFIKPRLLLTWAPDGLGQFRLRAEKVVGQLDFSNFVANADLSGSGVSAGNRMLKPDQRWQFEAAWDYHFWDRGALVLSVMREQIRDLVDYVPIGAGLDGPGNIAQATNMEYKINLTLPLDRLGLEGGTLKSSMQWDVSALTDPVTGRTRGISDKKNRDIQASYLQDVPAWQSSFELLVDTGGWTRPSYRIDQVSLLRLTSPFVQLSWSYKPLSDLEFTAQIINFLPYHMDIEQQNYAGPRNVASLSNVLDMRAVSQPRLYLRLRKTF